ncbi:transcriptional regulator [Azoarcus communis]|uniref:Transcriptional regulator n=1 Tax=Parazoarcus communis SWub3 = DSM 12120 TaxID=1121029 RepID=A0A323UTY8_9RHOO|nr:WYL domain-containing protein [Parazoarcus communis SWub3 = DSM 12120]PZA15984.1 transcriptional regulator [Azoarcus communis] [Parazoarcus communis SWub3 = DSM 12120]
MSQTDRLVRIRKLFGERRVVSRRALLETLEVSPATLKRDIAFLRDNMNTPIVWDREASGYRIAPSETSGAQFELPGMWFNDKEIHALLTMQHLLANLDPGGLLAPHVAPLIERLNKLLGAADNPTDEIRKRVLIVGIGKRSMKLAHFENIGSALLRRKRLLIRYFARSKNEEATREISPQRLVHYRENWYLDAWCHLRGALRNFAVDSIRHVELLDRKADDIPLPTVDTVLGPGYGIFAGSEIHWARLRFSAERARWVATEHWHPDQRGTFDDDGRYVLEVPFADHRELMMDVLKHGRHCEVLGPEELRQRVTEELSRMAKNFAEPAAGLIQ